MQACEKQQYPDTCALPGHSQVAWHDLVRMLCGRDMVFAWLREESGRVPAGEEGRRWQVGRWEMIWSHLFRAVAAALPELGGTGCRTAGDGGQHLGGQLRRCQQLLHHPTWQSCKSHRCVANGARCPSPAPLLSTGAACQYHGCVT